MRNQIKTIVLLGILSALLVAGGGAVAPGLLWLFTAIALAMNLFAFFFSDRLVLRMYGAREVSAAEAPVLHAMVDELSRAAGIPKPRVHVIDSHIANAFATGRDPRHASVAVTAGIMRLLDDQELRGVLAHEIGHVRNRDVLVATVAAGLATAVSHVGNALAFAGLFGRGEDDESSPAGGLAFALLAPITASLVQLGISRSREYLADESAARLSGDPLALASALEKLQLSAEAMPSRAEPATASLFIVNPLAGAGGALLRLFSTHPPIEERVRRLRAMAGRRSQSWSGGERAAAPRRLVRE
jgi:heat shock protein HtpX